MGGRVYAGEGMDTIVREFDEPTNPNTLPQQAQRGRFRRSTQGWSSLNDSQRSAWNTAAKSVMSDSVRRQKQKPITGFCYYTKLSSKFYAANPNQAAPPVPPTGTYTGDDVKLTAAGASGEITITADKANKTGTTTELMVQPLKASYIKPAANGYRCKAYVAFATGTLSTALTLAEGSYSVAAQFVELSSGRTAGYQVLGTYTVSRAHAEANRDNRRKAA